MYLRRRHRSGLASVIAILAILMVSSVAIAGGRASLPGQRSPIQSAPTPVPTGSIGITSWTHWVVGGSLYIAGDVFNNTSDRLDTQMDAALYNASDVLLTTWTFSAGAWLLAAGTHSPFAYSDTAPAGFDHVVVSVDPFGFGQAIRGPLLITPGAPHTEGDGRHYPGTAKNLTSFYLRWVDVTIGLYDANGNVINALGEGEQKQFGQPIAPGETIGFDLVLPDHYTGATRVLMHAYAADYVDLNNIMVAWENYFDDIYNSLFRADIIWNAQQGITGGCAAGLYCPTDHVTRGQMAAFLARALHLSGSAPNAFTDDNGSIYEPSINLVAQAGIASGCGGTLFCPNGLVSRAQMATFLARALHLSGTAPDAFTDDNGSIYEPNINLVAREGIATGCGGTLFCPNANVTRGQMAAFLHRAFGP